MTDTGEACGKDIPYVDQDIIDHEEKYDGFYAICTDMADESISRILMINRKRWQIEECFRIIKTEFKANPSTCSVRKDQRTFLTCFLAYISTASWKRNWMGASPANRSWIHCGA